jgi:hypothetical protein
MVVDIYWSIAKLGRTPRVEEIRAFERHLWDEKA